MNSKVNAALVLASLAVQSNPVMAHMRKVICSLTYLPSSKKNETEAIKKAEEKCLHKMERNIKHANK